jgi:hypothetical protein
MAKTKYTDKERIERKKESVRKYQEKNKDRLKSYRKEYYIKNKEVIKEKSKKYIKDYQKNNREKINRRTKEWRNKNPQKVKEYRIYGTKRLTEQQKLQKKKKKKEWDDINKEKNKLYRKRNKVKFYEYKKEWRKINKQREHEKNNIYRKKNKERDREKNRIRNTTYTSNKYKSKIEYKVLCNIRSRLRRAIKENKKSDKTIELLGCSIHEFKKYLESKFTNGMNWGNYGIKGWHFDHIIPCDVFDLTKSEAQKFCFNYLNLQPMWWIENIKKSSNVDFELLKKIDVNLLKEKYVRLLNEVT